jgi:GT2 family glycosyltransferase
MVDGVHIPYVEGWCVAAARTTWQRLAGFDAATYERPYWEDVDLSFRAMTLGIGLYRSAWQVEHLSNTTSAVTPGAYDASEANRLSFETRVREHLGRRAAA